MSFRSHSVLLTLWCVITAAASERPHVVFILADDLGWNDVSFHGSDQIPTPNIDALAYQGVVLNRHYAQPVCTPSRASLMTGKHPIHTGQHWPYGGPQRSGLPLSEKLMPQYFKELGYATHVVGKWHLGFYRREYTPLQRGFDSHLGYWAGAISYFDHILEDQVGNRTLCGYDMRRDYSVAWDLAGHYATDVFTREAVRLVDTHPPDTPMFLLVSHLAVHAGNPGKLLEAPQEVVDRFPYIRDPNRRTYADVIRGFTHVQNLNHVLLLMYITHEQCKVIHTEIIEAHTMVSKLDESVGEVVDALGRRNMLENSIIVFLSDNGAPNIGHYNNWGSNYPWRGQKATLFEGGVRTPCVVWSPGIARPSRVSAGLMHITDWLPTLLSAAGYRGPLPDIDGVDQWRAITHDLPSPRDSVLLDIYDEKRMYGIIMGPYKYIHGATAYPHSTVQSGYSNLDSIFSRNTPPYNVTDVLHSKAYVRIEDVSRNKLSPSKVISLRRQATISCEKHNISPLNCDEGPCIFNLAEDPCEQKNVVSYYPVLRLFMELVLSYYKAGAYPEELNILDIRSDPDRFNGTWSIWVT